MNLNQLYTKLSNINVKIDEITKTIDRLAFIKPGSNLELSIEELQEEYLELIKEKNETTFLCERALLSNLVDIEDARGESSERVTLKEVQLSLSGNTNFLNRLKSLRDQYYNTFNAGSYIEEQGEPNFDPGVLDETIAVIEDRIDYLKNIFDMASFQVNVE